MHIADVTCKGGRTYARLTIDQFQIEIRDTQIFVHGVEWGPNGSRRTPVDPDACGTINQYKLAVEGAHLFVNGVEWGPLGTAAAPRRPWWKRLFSA